jgi:hypothetical protein
LFVFIILESFQCGSFICVDIQMSYPQRTWLT